VGIGVLSWIAFLTADHPLGITTSFEHAAALAIQAVVPDVASKNDYFESETPKIGWEAMLVVGVLVGGLFSSFMSGDQENITVPSLWQWRFGNSVALRLVVAFGAGALMMFGARLAQGCTSGHGISGTLQLAASSWLFTILLFATAIVTTFMMYGKEGRNHV
jgi:uncharacterized membrane protein YedE/YeeE